MSKDSKSHDFVIIRVPALSDEVRRNHASLEKEICKWKIRLKLFFWKKERWVLKSLSNIVSSKKMQMTRRFALGRGIPLAIPLYSHSSSEEYSSGTVKSAESSLECNFK